MADTQSTHRRVHARTLTDAERYLVLRAMTLRKYGITPATYDAMHRAQGGLCAICGKPETGRREGRLKLLCVDHDHDAPIGQVRELLCCRCNQGIALLGEDPALLRQAAAYLERHRAATT